MATGRNALVALVILGGAGTASASTWASAPSRSPAVHPPATRAAAAGALTRCPSSEGLERFTARDARAAVAVAKRYDDEGRAAKLADSDRAWWPEVESHGARRKKSPREHFAVVGHQPLAGDRDFGSIVSRACGSSLMSFTETVAVGPSSDPEHCDACISTFFFVDRLRHPLVYFIY